jgi:hypothetical protein
LLNSIFPNKKTPKPRSASGLLHCVWDAENP